MNAGEVRNGLWLFRNEGAIRIDVRKGFDCRRTCQHVPPQKSDHGQHGDEWSFNVRRESTALSLLCFTRIRGGQIIYESMATPPVYGAWLHFHDGRIPKRVSCNLLTQGCSPECLGALGVRDTFVGFSEVVEPFAFRALENLDDRDLENLAEKLPRLWQELFARLKACEEDITDENRNSGR